MCTAEGSEIRLNVDLPSGVDCRRESVVLQCASVALGDADSISIVNHASEFFDRHNAGANRGHVV